MGSCVQNAEVFQFSLVSLRIGLPRRFSSAVYWSLKRSTISWPQTSRPAMSRRKSPCVDLVFFSCSLVCAISFSSVKSRTVRVVISSCVASATHGAIAAFVPVFAILAVSFRPISPNTQLPEEFVADFRISARQDENVPSGTRGEDLDVNRFDCRLRSGPDLERRLYTDLFFEHFPFGIMRMPLKNTQFGSKASRLRRESPSLSLRSMATSRCGAECIGG